MHNNEFITTGTQFASLDRKKMEKERTCHVQNLDNLPYNNNPIFHVNKNEEQIRGSFSLGFFFFSSQYCPIGIQQ